MGLGQTFQEEAPLLSSLHAHSTTYGGAPQFPPLHNQSSGQFLLDSVSTPFPRVSGHAVMNPTPAMN